MSDLPIVSPLTHLNEEEQFFYDTIKDFAVEKIKPHVAQMDRDATMRPEILKQFFEMGLMGIHIPEMYGGAATNFFMSVLAIEALATVDGSAAVVVDVQNTLVNNCFLNWASEDIKKRYLPLLAEEKIGAYALSEAASGSDAFALECRAEERADHWVLNGQKMWITNAGEAEIFIVFANTDFSKGYKGISAFVVEKGFSGFSIGKKEDKLGIRASSTCELIFEECRVPKNNVLGEVGQGYKAAIETLNEGRIGIGAQMVGIAQGAFDAGVQYVKERRQFGKAIGKFQGVQFQLADAATKLEAARLLVYNAARMKDAGLPFLKQAAMSKLYASQAAQEICSLMIDLFGGYGFTKEYPVEKFYRDAKIGTIYEGTSNMQLMTIAKFILGDF